MTYETGCGPNAPEYFTGGLADYMFRGKDEDIWRVCKHHGRTMFRPYNKKKGWYKCLSCAKASSVKHHYGENEGAQERRRAIEAHQHREDLGDIEL